MDRLYIGSLIVFILISISSCHKSEGKKDEQLNNLYGSYFGTTNGWRTAYDFNILESASSDYVINSLLGVTIPGISVDGNVNATELILNDYKCNHCEGLSSFGGSPRYYTATLSGHGTWYPEQDSIVLFIDYKMTGDFIDDFVGEIYLKKGE